MNHKGTIYVRPGWGSDKYPNLIKLKLKWSWLSPGEAMRINFGGSKDIVIHINHQDGVWHNPGPICGWKGKPDLDKPSLDGPLEITLNGYLIFNGFIREGRFVGYN